MQRLSWLVVAAGLMVGSAAQAATITFGPGPYGSPVATTVEGAFTYDTYSGGLFRDDEGNGDLYDMEGCSACGGGVLRILRNDLPGGVFTFDGADIAFQFDGEYPISFSGYLNGALVGTDTFNTALGSVYTTHASSVLAGLAIDELRVQLDAQGTFATVVDNVVLTPAVPEPSTVLFLGLAAGGFVARRRLRRRA